MLTQINSGNDIQSFVKGSLKLEVLLHSLYRKGLVTDEYKITLEGKTVIDFLNVEETDITTIEKVVIPESSFADWWKAYPGTDTFKIDGMSFTGTRSLRVKKEDCKKKFEQIIAEGQCTVEEMILALNMEVDQKKKKSLKDKTNRMMYMQNSLTYLNQRSFEPFIELVRQGVIIEQQNQTGGTDI